MSLLSSFLGIGDMSESEGSYNDLGFPRRGDVAMLAIEARETRVWKNGTMEGREKALDGAEALW